ncbi:MAG: patatin-like phospholipase family protein [Alphaproteobacteria bacterium]|nr:patatin-like phospholipase family protein [Alphaproteobacteria bacterium]
MKLKLKSTRKPRNTVVVLYNYGGGMRGLVPAHLMQRIEETTGLAMVDLVDVFTGPSTGSILNAALNIPDPNNPARPKYAAADMVRFYEREGANIFPRDRFRDFRGLIHDLNNRTMKSDRLRKVFRNGHYDPTYMGQAMQKLFGNMHLDQTLKSLIIPFYNLDGDSLRRPEDMLQSDDAPVPLIKNNFVDQGGFAVWLKTMRMDPQFRAPKVRLRDAIQASTAAPTYFPSHNFSVDYPGELGRVDYTGIDGSVFSNPCVTYHGAIRHHLPKNTRVIMILLGTGHNLRSFAKDDWNRYGGLGVVDPVNDLPLISILFHASETALVESFRRDLGEDLFVFNKSMLRDVAPARVPSLQIDDASPENIAAMRYFAQDTIAENQATFDRLCNLLVQVYEGRRKKPPFWRRLRRRKIA